MTTIQIDPADLRDVIDQAVRAALEADRSSRPAPVEREDPLLVDSKEAARLLSVTPRALQAWAADGLISPVRLGRLVRWNIKDLERIAAEGVAET